MSSEWDLETTDEGSTMMNTKNINKQPSLYNKGRVRHVSIESKIFLFYSFVLNYYFYLEYVPKLCNEYQRIQKFD